MNNSIRFRLDPEIITALPGPDGMIPSHRVKHAFERHLNLYRWSLNEIQHTFTLGEMSLITDALNGIIFGNFDVEPAPQLQAELGDLDGSYFRKHAVDSFSFSFKLDALTNAQAAALIEAIERWWHDPDRQLTAEGFARHGLIVQEVHNE